MDLLSAKCTNYQGEQHSFQSKLLRQLLSRCEHMVSHCIICNAALQNCFFLRKPPHANISNLCKTNVIDIKSRGSIIYNLGDEKIKMHKGNLEG